MKFRAKCGGDGECFVLVVDEATFRKVEGDDHYRLEMESRDQFNDHGKQFYIYPHRLFGNGNVDIEITEKGGKITWQKQ